MGKPIPATKFLTASGEAVFVPLILVTIKHAGKEVRIRALIDSGADGTLIPAAHVAPLGIDYASLPPGPDGRGGGGGFGRRFCATAELYWNATHLMTGFHIAEPGKLDAPLLGRADFFKLYDIGFYWNENPPSFELVPVVAPAPVSSEPAPAAKSAKSAKKRNKKRH